MAKPTLKTVERKTTVTREQVREAMFAVTGRTVSDNGHPGGIKGHKPTSGNSKTR